MRKREINLRERLYNHIEFIYPDEDAKALAERLIKTMGLHKDCKKPKPHHNKWHEDEVIVITYGDTLQQESEKPLHTLHRFFRQHLSDVVTGIHILPFYPYSSDDGFSVINYKQVNESLGEWKDIESIASEYHLMADLVINHCSARSEWFTQFKKNKAPGKDYFATAPEDADLSEVVRPRTNPLLREVETKAGTRYVWCTFSHDQVDLNFHNPDLLVEIASIVNFYIERGVRIFRLDAVAFIWKEIGTNCLNLPQTHELVRLIRTLIEYKSTDAIIITETNIPNRENLAYFGNANEAHVIYNFALPPLVLHALLTGDNYYINNWLMSMPPAQDGTTYLNFLASHDGIGLRPVEGILSEEEINQITDAMQSFGGRISWRNLTQTEVRPYEINISLIDAMSGTLEGPDEFKVDRFVCAHTIMVGLEGIPAFYIHSLLGTENDNNRVEMTGNNRSINRHIWQSSDLEAALKDETKHHAEVLERLKMLIRIRTRQPAFHPNATQYTLHLGEGIFAFWRQSRNRQQSIFCIHNITKETISIPYSGINLIETQEWYDLFTNESCQDLRGTLELQPYQSVWISNRLDATEQ